MKIGFMSTSNFGLLLFKELLKENNISFLISSKPKKRGRGHKIRQLEIVELAKEYKVKHFLIDKKSDLFQIPDEIFKSTDLILVIDFSFIIPSSILNCGYFVNIHPSLLPKYRGASPIHYALLNLDSETGITIQKVSPELDKGEILIKEKYKIFETDNFISLYDRLRKNTIHIFKKFLNNINFIKPEPQVGESVYAKKIKKEDAKISFKMKSFQITGKIKAFSKWPRVKVLLNSKDIYFINAIYRKNLEFEGEEGEVVCIEKFEFEYPEGIKKELGMCIKASDGVFIVNELQKPGKKILKLSDFILGFRDLKIGSKFSIGSN